MKITYIDLETTSVNCESCDIIQLAYKKVFDNQIIAQDNQYFKNVKEKITLWSKVLTWLTEKMICNYPSFEESGIWNVLREKIKDSIYVAHNGVEFDFKVLSNYWIKYPYIIDTYIVASQILADKAEELENSFKLQYLRYYFEEQNLISLPENIIAHDAFSDILVLEQVFLCLFNIYKNKYPTKTDEEILKDFVLMTIKPLFIEVMPFWKYKGQLTRSIPSNTLEWYLTNMPTLSWNLKFTFTTLLQERNQSSSLYQASTETQTVVQPSIPTQPVQTTLFEENKNDVINKVKEPVAPEIVYKETTIETLKENKEGLPREGYQSELEVNEQEFCFN